MMRICRARFITAFAVVFGLSGCADTTGPSLPNLSGQWSYSATNMVGPNGFSCNVGGATLALVQAGVTFTGSYSGGTITCLGDGGFVSSRGNIGGAVISGVISGQQVGFNFDTSDFANSGTVSGGSITGTATMVLVAGSSRVVLTGPFGAARR